MAQENIVYLIQENDPKNGTHLNDGPLKNPTFDLYIPSQRKYFEDVTYLGEGSLVVASGAPVFESSSLLDIAQVILKGKDPSYHIIKMNLSDKALEGIKEYLN